MAVAALKFKKYEKGAMRGFLSVRYHGMTITGCRVMQNKGGGFWIALPQKEATIDGEMKWIDIIQMGRDEQDFLSHQVVGQLRRRGDLDGSAPLQDAPLPDRQNPDHGDAGMSEYYPGAGDQDDLPF